MPKPFGQQPDEKPVHEQVRDLVRKAHTDRMAPVGVVFSQTGYRKALGQTVPGFQAFTGGQGQHHVATHYLGLPFRISNDHTGRDPTVADVVLDLVPGGSAEAKAFRASQGLRSVNRTFEHRPDPVRVTAKGPMDRPTIEVLAEGLTKPQLCDLIAAWCDANQDDSMVDGLRDTVAKHGLFE